MRSGAQLASQFLLEVSGIQTKNTFFVLLFGCVYKTVVCELNCQHGLVLHGQTTFFLLG